jgi:hypothetical protein
MKLTLTAVLLILAAPTLAGMSEHPYCAPEAIQALAVKIQGKAPAEVRGEIIRRFGSNPRHIGSGIRIEAWQLPEGVLVFNPLVGPTFTDAKTKRQCWLIRTTNLAGTNIWQSYEMFTLPDASNHGNQFWLGNLDLSSDETYRFSDSDQFPDQRSNQAENFFMRRPRGKVHVQYEMPTSPDTPLESLEEGVVVARVIFTSSEDNETATFSIASSEQDRRLVFRADTPLSFSMAPGWQSYWQ